MEIKLDPEAVASIASAAILQSLSAEQRDEVIKQAVSALLRPDEGRGFGSGKTPLQKAFDSAIANAAYRVVQEHIANVPEVEEAILKLLGPVLNGIVKEQSSQYNDELSGVIGSAVGSWLADRARA